MEVGLKEYGINGFTKDDLQKYLTYDLELGLLWWKERTPEMFHHTANPDVQCRAWNARFSGKFVGSVDNQGYLRLGLEGKRISVHRCLVFLRDGYLIKGSVIDHIDRVKTNNKSKNLRVVSFKDNSRNKVMQNSIGFSGVRKNGSGFSTSICVDGDRIHGGTHKTPEEAYDKYLELKKEYHKITSLT